MNWSLLGFGFCLVAYGIMASSYFYFMNKNSFYTLLCNISIGLFIIGLMCFGAKFI